MLKIIVADDHSRIRKALSQILEEAFPGCRVKEASDGDSLFNISGEDNCDIIISDLNMPGGGVQMIRKLKQLLPQTPLIVFTIHHEAIYASWILQSGASHYLPKGSDPDELINSIKKLIPAYQ